MENIKDNARKFAISAHSGQVRKSEPDKPMIIHPFDVARKLQDFGYDDNMVAAGYLHDVVEDTEYTIEDIRENFGDDVADLVYGASEPDKSLSWEDRKKHTIKAVKKLSLRNKIVVCADKISNLEDLMIIIQKSGKRDFSHFKRGESYQKWYYSDIYKSIIYNEDKDIPIFNKLRELIDIVFNFKEDVFLRETVFSMDNKYYSKLKKLHAQKMELQKLKKLCPLQKPYVIELCGTPRTGKTSMYKNLSDFFERGGFKVAKIEEFMNSKYYKNDLKDKFKKMSIDKFMSAVVQEITIQLENCVEQNVDVILIDRGLNDRIVWNNRYYKKSKMTEDMYFQLKDQCETISKKIVNHLVITYVNSLESLRRDYAKSLALEERSFLNLTNLEEYNDSLMDLKYSLKDNVNSYIFLDTMSINTRDTAVEVASNILIAMREEYIREFKKSINNI
ncbi:MAG: HD domain-containing protein [Clostridia bacterium]|nr:HD domain-containing protein [Clostridia bacterium]